MDNFKVVKATPSPWPAFIKSLPHPILPSKHRTRFFHPTIIILKKLLKTYTKQQNGEEVVVLRHGKKIARLTPLPSDSTLPSLKELRNSLPAAGDTLSNTVVRNREEERY